MKKLIALLLAALMLVSLLTACAKPENDEPLPEDTENEETEEPKEEETPEEDPTLDEPATMPEDPTMDQPATMPEMGVTPDMGVTPEVGEPTVDEGLQTLMTDIYAIQAPEFMTMEMPVNLSNPDDLYYFTGLTDASLITSALVSESAMGSQAYSLVLVRAADASKLSEIADAMESGIDTRKWICVEADDLRVVGAGDVVMLIMVESAFADTITADGMVDAFVQAIGLDLDVE